MNRKLLAAVVSGAMALPMASSAQDADAVKVPDHSHPSVLEHEHDLGEGDEKMMVPMHGHQYQSHPAAAHGHDELHGHPDVTLYGTLRYGVTFVDNGKSSSDTELGLGDAYTSSFGVRGTTPVGEGMTGGFQIERGIGDDALTARHHNVYLSGAFGTVKLGQQSMPYYGATTWDGAAHLGGVTDGDSRGTGVSFSSDLGGPFNFSAFASDGVAGDRGAGADHIEVTGTFAGGPLSLSAGYQEEVAGTQRIGGTVSGTAANITLLAGYEAATDVVCEAAVTAATSAHTVSGATVSHEVTPASAAMLCDEDRYGFTLSYSMGEGAGGGQAYVQYGQLESDDAFASKRDVDYWTVGYSYYVTEAVHVRLVHQTKNAYEKDDAMRLKSNTSAVVLKVDF